MSQPVLDALVTTVGKAAVEGGECAGADPYTFQTEPRMRSLMDAFVKEYGSWSSDGSVTDFLLMEAAINATQSIDPDVIKAYIDNSPAIVQVPGGIIKFFARPELGNNRTISGCSSGTIGVIRDGKLLGGSITTLKDHYLFTIKTRNLVDAWKPWWEQYGYPQFPAEQKELSTFNPS